MEPGFEPRLSEEALQNSNVKPAASFAQSRYLSLDPIPDDSNSNLTTQFKSKSEIFFKPHSYAYGKRHSILGTGSRSAFRKPNLSELKEKYRSGKERAKEWNIDKMWASHVERTKRKALASVSDIVTAVFWIRDGVPRTSCERVSSIPEIDEVDVYIKREYQNPSGSFHDRGARYALLRLQQSQKNLGVITVSSGNFAVALAYQGNSLGIPVTVLLPESTSPVKIRMCERFDADTRISSMDERKLRERAIEIEQERGLTFIDGNNNPEVVCGEGTMGLEIIDQLEGIDAIIVPVGEGTLLAGTCIAVKTLYPSIKIIGVKSDRRLAGKPTLRNGATTRTNESNELSSVDDLIYSEIPDAPLKLAESLMDKCVTVREDHIALAILRLLENDKVILETDGAAGLGALIGGYLPELKGKRVVVVLSEGNMEPGLVPRVISHGLTTDGRLVRFEVRIDDQLSTMATLLRLITSTGAIIKDVSQEQVWNDPSLLGLQAKVMVEVSDREHSRQLKSLLNQNFHVTFCNSAVNSKDYDGSLVDQSNRLLQNS